MGSLLCVDHVVFSFVFLTYKCLFYVGFVTIRNKSSEHLWLSLVIPLCLWIQNDTKTGTSTVCH